MDSSIGIKVIWNRLHTFIVKKADILKQIDQINKNKEIFVSIFFSIKIQTLKVTMDIK